MKKKSQLTTMLFALVTAAGLAACGADDEEKAEVKGKAIKATDGNPVVEMKTSLGSFQVELFRDKSPITVANFLKYVEKKHYDGLIFHRVMKTFMIQGGGFEKDDPRSQRKTMPPIKNEAVISGLKNDKYTIAMARTRISDSATSQFFINVVDNGYRLDPNPRADPNGYAVFGKVIEGQGTVDKIRDTPTVIGSPENSVPVTQVVIESVRLVEKKAAVKKTEEKTEEKKEESK